MEATKEMSDLYKYSDSLKEVCKYLPLQDVARCKQLSKEWNNTLSREPDF